jgi:hypothetical protein
VAGLPAGKRPCRAAAGTWQWASDMDHILAVHSKIYDQFHGSKAYDDHFSKKECAAEYAAYYTSMYLIQDTGESVSMHMKRGFLSNLVSYIEFWGIMQAIIIQQDAIKELHEAVIGPKPTIRPESESAWMKIRNLRNLCAGHPAKRTKRVPTVHRTFMGRSFGNYDGLRYELWDAHTKQRSYPIVNLRAMIQRYDTEAAEILNNVLRELETKWQKTVTPSDTPSGHVDVSISLSPGFSIVIGNLEDGA